MPILASSTPFPVFERRLVAFVDVLGWTSAVEAAAAHPNLPVQSNGDKLSFPIEPGTLSAIQALLMTARPFLDRHRGYAAQHEQSDFRFTFFSDSFVFSELLPDEAPPNTREHIRFLLDNIANYAVAALICGFLLRGGIAVGPLIHDDHFCLGPALHRAYALESRVARVARIAVDNDCARELSSFFGWRLREFGDAEKMAPFEMDALLTFAARHRAGSVGEGPSVDLSEQLSQALAAHQSYLLVDDDGVQFLDVLPHSMSVIDGLAETLRERYGGRGLPGPIAEKVNWFLRYFNAVAPHRGSSGFEAIPLCPLE